MRHSRWMFAAVTVFVVSAGFSMAIGQEMPSTGCERPELAAVDEAMSEFMWQNGVIGATVAIALDGEIVYERGFGWRDQARTMPMQHDALMRLASVSKPITVAAVREQISAGLYSLDSFVFDLGQVEGGLLSLEPFPVLGDLRLADVRVRHLIEHTGGWDRGIAGDLTYREVQVATDFGVTSPPGRELTLRWILGHPLQFAPGKSEAYSNIGCLVFGLIVEKYADQSLIEFLDEKILGPIGIASEDHEQGRTFAADKNPREPWYQRSTFSLNVFDPEGPAVERPYGGWDHEARIGQGGQIATAGALAVFAAHHWVAGSNIGLPKAPDLRGTWRWNHTGAFDGTSSLIRQRGDGVTYGVIMNRTGSLGTPIRLALDPVLDGIIVWPSGAPNCCPADLAPPFGVLDFDDVLAFLVAFGAMDPAADLSEPFGVIDFDDVLAFLVSFGGGCP